MTILAQIAANIQVCMEICQRQNMGCINYQKCSRFKAYPKIEW